MAACREVDGEEDGKNISSMTTKDEQPGREPLLSNYVIKDMSEAYSKRPVFRQHTPPFTHSPFSIGAKEVRDFYEDKITKGELMVVKTAKGVLLGMSLGVMRRCEHCTQPWTGPHSMSFCPGCGAKIVE